MNNNVHFNFRRRLRRRSILRGSGVAMSLPWLSAMQPAFASDSQSGPPRRFVAVSLGLGLHGPFLNPEDAGRGYKPSRYLKGIEDLRDQMTVISGSSHPGMKGGHRAEAGILTANPIGGSGNGKNSISVDQLMAKYLGGETRFPSLVLGSSSDSSPSYTESGAMIPAESSPARLFRQLFVNSSKKEQIEQTHRAKQGQSIMDLVAEDAKKLARELGTGDRERLGEYFNSVREMEKRLQETEAWATRPKPVVDMPPPTDVRNSNDFIAKQKLMNDMIRLALQTDSTRFITYHMGGAGGVVPIPGVEEGYHSLSHHGREQDKIDQLALIEAEIVKAWGGLVRDLASLKEGNESVLDRTSVMLTSNLGNASSHDNRNMPVVFAGGGFKHGQHLAFDQKNNYPLPNLYVSILQRLGLEIDSFVSSTGTMTGLEMAS